MHEKRLAQNNNRYNVFNIADNFKHYRAADGVQLNNSCQRK
jgi:hypothetical protein